MGVNCKLNLPPGTRISDVMMVMSKLLGFPAEYVDFKLNSTHSGTYLKCDGVTYINTHTPELLYLRWKDVTGGYRQAPWYFEGENGTRVLFPSSTPFWCAMCKRLVEFFGGSLIYCDTHDEPNLVVHDKSFNANDDVLYKKFQNRVVELKPLTREEIASFVPNSAYGSSDDYEYYFDSDGIMTQHEPKKIIARVHEKKSSL